MAAIGSAVGLGNLWRFPFQAGANGGSAFVFVYLLCVLLIAFPVLVAELTIGRRTGKSVVGAARDLGREANLPVGISFVALSAMVAGFLVLSTYSVIAGRIMAYALGAFLGQFTGDPTGETALSTTIAVYDGPTLGVGWHTLFMGLTIIIVARGIHAGIERVVSILMPVFFVMLAGLCLFSMSVGDPAAALSYLFQPRFSELTPQIVLAAMGQALFSLGVGAGILTAYGAHMRSDENIIGDAAIVSFADTLVAIVAGLMIFPIVFANGLDPAEGPGLIFNALPRVFAQMPGGAVIGGLFFLLAFVAALTSSISLLMGVSSVIEQETGLGRSQAAGFVGTAVWAVGVSAILMEGLNRRLDYVSGNVLLPIGALFIVVLAGWIARKESLDQELRHASTVLRGYWRFCTRYIAPVAIVLILIFGVK